MKTEARTAGRGRLATLAQAGLAALVAGTLLTFSTIAFNTAFDNPSTGNKVAVSTPKTAPAAPLVLPTPVDAEEVRIAQTPPEASGDTVLGIRVEAPSATAENPSSDARRERGSKPENAKWKVHADQGKARAPKKNGHGPKEKGHGSARHDRKGKRDQGNHSHESNERDGHGHTSEKRSTQPGHSATKGADRGKPGNSGKKKH